MLETKKCPFCGKEINSKAIKCKHCGEWLENPNYNKDNGDNNNSYKVATKIMITILCVLITILLVITFLHFYNPTWVDKELNTKTKKTLDDSENTITKSDYSGDWSNGRAGLSLENVENNKIRMYAMWSSSSVSRSEWSFDCEYENNKGYLVCKNGTETDYFTVCNGKRFDDAGSFDECENDYPETITDGAEQVYNNASGKIIIKMGNPSSCNLFNNWSEKNIVLKFYNDSYTNDSLQSTCFAKGGYYTYSDKTKYIDEYQDKYFKIIKDGNISNLKTIEKHQKAINSVFNEFKDKYNKKIEYSEILNYFAKLEKIDEQYTSTNIKSTISTAKEYNKAVDDLLNEIYQKIKKIVQKKILNI